VAGGGAGAATGSGGIVGSGAGDGASATWDEDPASKSVSANAAPAPTAAPISNATRPRRGGWGADGGSGEGGRLRSSFSSASRIELTTIPQRHR
jgi:hypothetical protein